MEHLIGMLLPALALVSTSGVAVDLSTLRGFCVLFCYPYTGRPGHPNPPGWDDIPGAHGSTPQALAYSRLYPEFRKWDASVFGLSIQDQEWQRDFVARNALAFPLLSDVDRKFSRALGLPAFRAGDQDYLRRLTLVIEDGVIAQVRYPIDQPEADAEAALEMLRAQTSL